MAYAFDIETLYSNTDNGLDIIKKYLSNCKGFDKALQNQKEHFHFRESDDTASAQLIGPDKNIKSATVNYWRVKDFGDDFFTPIKIAMQFTGLDFYPCLKFMYEIFGLTQGKTFFQAETEVTTLDKEDKRKVGFFDFTEASKHHDLGVIGRFVTTELAAEYHFKSIDFYEKVFIKKGTENKTYIKVKATPSFPIFAYAPDGKKWCKTYAPLSNDKQYKHGYLGAKPERYIHGLERLKNAFAKEMAAFDKRIAQAKKDNSEFLEAKLIAAKSEFKFDRAIICSGGSDGLNVTSLQEFALWFNSESEQLNYVEYFEILKYVKAIYNLADIDESGIKYAYEVAEKFFDLKTIWLPKEKLGITGKDFRDWMKFYNNADIESIKRQFWNLVNGALKMRFYEKNEKTKAIKIKPTYLHYFLKVKGFHLYYPEKQFTDKIAEQEYIFIRVVDNIVSQIFPNDIRKFCERYLIAKGESIAVIDCIKSTVQFNDKNLMGIDNIVLDFRNYTMSSQTFFFKNLYATVTADNIELKPYKNYKNFVWNDAILQTNIFKEEPFFKHTIDESGNDKVEILRTDCEFQNFLINTSRMFWRKELEDQFTPEQTAEKKAYHEANRFNLFGECLSDEEKDIQAKHFLNKCFSIGYLLHKAKRQSFAKSLYAIDDKPKESEEDANGRSGKSILFFGIDQIAKNRFLVDGKNKNLTTDKHLLHGLTKENDYLYVEDLGQFVDVEDFYNWITGSIVVNPKNTKPYEVKFFDAPKVAITSNYGIPKMKPSTQGRLLFLSFSDYYHVKTDHYNEERKVNADFGGMDLFSPEWTEKQYNKHFNFLFECLQLYLNNFNHEISAPQSNIDINNANASMGDVFMNWADSYFVKTQDVTVSKEVPNESKLGEMITMDEVETITGTLNEYIERKQMQASYAESAGRYPKTPQNFLKSLRIYCKQKGYELNPKELCNGDETKILKPITDKHNKRQIVEHFFIKTPTLLHIPAVNQEEKPVAEKKPSDDLAF